MRFSMQPAGVGTLRGATVSAAWEGVAVEVSLAVPTAIMPRAATTDAACQSLVMSLILQLPALAENNKCAGRYDFALSQREVRLSRYGSHVASIVPGTAGCLTSARALPSSATRAAYPPL